MLAGVDLSGSQALVTGAGGGPGAETARALASAGAEVVLAVRRPEAAEEFAQPIRASTNDDDVTVAALDLAPQESIRTFFGSWSGPLHMLVHNAGIMALPELARSPEGWEMQFATNFMGHFLLTVGLHDALTEAQGARVVLVSSTGHLFSPVVFYDLHYRFRPYDPWTAYGQAKSAAILIAS